ncbi:hypothetical protein EDB87DRAFT_1154644 [Lactarius vividus]|nr:hypothetical protein EDB87DRAFT_1154644 [Lactarius vividus]
MRLSCSTFLRRLVRQDPEIRVLLDVGAQMLELQNEELARHWLFLVPHISAAIFFDESDHLTVLTQDGTIEPLTTSPINRQLDKCIVYLDDAHTRGTDLKLPRETRAAVTLGPKVTKDRLLQGCMRMRQLGKGQSVMFFALGDARDLRRYCSPPPALGTTRGRPPPAVFGVQTIPFHQRLLRARLDLLGVTQLMDVRIAEEQEPRGQPRD